MTSQSAPVARAAATAQAERLVAGLRRGDLLRRRCRSRRDRAAAAARPPWARGGQPPAVGAAGPGLGEDADPALGERAGVVLPGGAERALAEALPELGVGGHPEQRGRHPGDRLRTDQQAVDLVLDDLARSRRGVEAGHRHAGGHRLLHHRAGSPRCATSARRPTPSPTRPPCRRRRRAARPGPRAPTCGSRGPASARSGPVPQIRSRHSGIWSAISANAATSSGNCFSCTSRPAVRISGLSSRDRGLEAQRAAGWASPRSAGTARRAARAATPRAAGSASPRRRPAGRS